MNLKKFFSELKRRNVYKVAIAYSITSWLLAQLTSLAADSFNAPEWVMKMILVVLIIGFPIALILAWAFEMSPRGITRTISKDKIENDFQNNVKNDEKEGIHDTSEIFEYDHSDTIPQTINDKSIAVLPFVNMSSDPEQEFFCEGISEEIINTIVQFPDIKVVGRTSSFSFKGENEDLRSVGTKLGVSKILEGSVRKSGNRVRITAQLIEAFNGFHLWSKTYDRELVDVFNIQDEIALEITNLLEVSLLGFKSKLKSRVQTQSVEAYQLYNKGRSFFYKRGMPLFEALKCFQSALEIDPNYALAASGLSDTYVMLSFHGYMSPVECWAGAIPSAQKALKYGPELAETHNTLAVIALLHDRNLKNAEREFVRALEINPSTIQARVWYGLFYFTQILGNFEKGIEQLKIAIEKDPLSSYAHSCLGIGLATGNKLEESIEIGKFAVKLDPNSMIARFNLCYGYLWSGQLDQALEQGLIAVESSNRHAWTLHQILLIYLKIDQRDKALKIYDELEEKYKNHSLPPSSMAISAAAIGKDKYALELALKAVDIYDPFLPYNAFKLKNAEALRNIPGFDGVIKRLGYFDKN